MKENKLYYQDAYITEFTANVISQNQDEAGNWYVILNQTAFYPTGGGQPNDMGFLNSSPVLNVEEVNGEIRHYLNLRMENHQGTIKGRVDWNRRYDHMQQHAGQHILSAAFVEVTGYETVSFHLGKDILTIDLDTEELSLEEVEKVEELANAIILENRRIEIKWVTEGEIEQYPLRKKTSVTENIRLVIIPDFDYNGCGGTHPISTGEVASIKILDWERQKSKTRVQFVCGNRVRKQLHQKNQVLKEVGKMISSSEQLMVETIQNLLLRNGELDRTIKEMKDKLTEYEVSELLKNKQDSGIIAYVFQNRSIQELQQMAKMLTSADQGVIALLVTENDDRLQLVFSSGENTNVKMNVLIREVLPYINGKGGGNERLSQGGGENMISGKELIDKSIKIMSE
ncbi:alanyl-tRNA editing protein [Bacillus sp. AK128]